MTTFSRKVSHASRAILQNFSMSPELAKAIGAVVVQALTENAKEETQTGTDDFDSGFDDDFDLDESELEESSRDAGTVQEAEGPKNAPDLSQDFAELKSSVKNLSENSYDAYRSKVKNFFSVSRHEY